MRFTLTSSLFVGFLLAAFAGPALVAARDTSAPACDRPDGTIPQYRNGKATGYSNKHLVPTEITNDPLYYVKPGTGACGVTYTNADAGACVNRGWVHSGYVDGCNGRWLEIHSSVSGVTVTAPVRDVCGAPGDEFGCEDLRLTLATFSALANGDQAIIKANNLPGPLVWKFVQEPCWGCEAGLPGILPAGQKDTCEGPDSYGVQRHGRKRGKEIRKGHAAGVHCTNIIEPGVKDGGHTFDEKVFIDAEVEHTAKKMGVSIARVQEMVAKVGGGDGDGQGH